MKRILGKIAFVWFAAVFAGIFLLFYPFFLLFLSHEKLYPAANFLRRVWAYLSVFLSFSYPAFRPFGHRFPEKSIFVANHTSYLDIVVMGLFAPLKVVFIGKQELAEIPLFGIFFRTVDIAVRRESVMDSHKAFQLAGKRLDMGYSVLMFPEGTIWNRTPELKAFKNGAFKLAIEKGVPIVPLTFLNNYKILPDGKFEYHPSAIRCKIHRAIATDHLNVKDADDLKDEIYQIIRKDLIKNHIIHENNG